MEFGDHKLTIQLNLQIKLVINNKTHTVAGVVKRFGFIFVWIFKRDYKLYIQRSLFISQRLKRKEMQGKRHMFRVFEFYFYQLRFVVLTYYFLFFYFLFFFFLFIMIMMWKIVEISKLTCHNMRKSTKS